MIEGRMEGNASVQIVGGLGNQLFGLSAGLWASHSLNLGLKVDTSNVMRTLRPTDDNTQRFLELDLLELPLAGNDSVIEFVEFPYRRQWKGEPRVVRMLSRIGLHGRDHWGKPWAVDERILEIAPRSLLRGNFHTFGYYERLRQSGESFPLQLKRRSSWTHNHVAKANLSKPIAVHLRLDDYLALLPDLVVTHDYLNQALDAIDSDFESSPIWVFTDDSARASGFLSRLNVRKREIVWIIPPKDVRPAEIMEVMSKCGAIVASCSSFSIWAGQFSLPETKVVVPNSALTLFGAEGFPDPWLSL
jgi:hypothetical protein